MVFVRWPSLNVCKPDDDLLRFSLAGIQYVMLSSITAQLAHTTASLEPLPGHSGHALDIYILVCAILQIGAYSQL